MSLILRPSGLVSSKRMLQTPLPKYRHIEILCKEFQNAPKMNCPGQFRSSLNSNHRRKVSDLTPESPTHQDRSSEAETGTSDRTESVRFGLQERHRRPPAKKK